MLHLYLLSLIIAMMAGLLTAGVYIHLYQKYKLDIIKYYLHSFASTIFLVFFSTLTFYLYLNMGLLKQSPKLLFGYTASVLFFSAPIIYTNPIFNREIVGLKNTRKVKILFLILAIITAVSGVIIFTEGYMSDLETIGEFVSSKVWLFLAIWIGVLPLFSNIGYIYIILLKYYKRIDDPYRKSAALYSIILSTLSIFLIYFDWRAQHHQFETEQYPVGIFLQPLLLFINSLFALNFLRSARKLNLQKSQKIPQSFILKYKITDREIEIIEMINSGLSNKEIASKLFLSPSTVRNHISNIFEKTETPTRGKLINLIKSLAS